MKKTTHRQQDFVNVATFNGVPEAEGLKSLLRTAGVQAEVLDETRLQKYWLFVEPKAGIHVGVPKESVADAQVILEDRRASQFMRVALSCPSCKSHRVQYPAVTRKNLLPTLAAQTLSLLRITQPKYYCEDCHFTWPEEANHKRGARTAISRRMKKRTV